tara:strand:+ start:566 stop:799 length:234 start_codon:yes stop_codon:yes gene_type:complete
MKITKSQLKQIIKEEVTNMNRSLGDFAQWVAEVDGHVESISGEYISAEELPSDVNLYDLWLSGLTPDQAAADLVGGA